MSSSKIFIHMNRDIRPQCFCHSLSQFYTTAHTNKINISSFPVQDQVAYKPAYHIGLQLKPIGYLAYCFKDGMS